MPGIRDGLTDRKELVIINVSLRKLYVNTANLEKTCKICEKTFPRNTEYFYAKRHHSAKGQVLYHPYCIACDTARVAKYRKISTSKLREKAIAYRKSEHGYFMGLWNGVKKSNMVMSLKILKNFLTFGKNNKRHTELDVLI